MKIGIHQANFIPWFPFFYKMAMCDVFVVMVHVQFEKNNYQNRYRLSTGEWVTKPVHHGLSTIADKKFTDGNDVAKVNALWIKAIKETLGIKTRLVIDYPTELTGTERLIHLIKHYEADTYVTHPDAKNKYLNEELMMDRGIDIEYCEVPKHLQIHTFEAFEKLGIQSLMKQLPRREVLV